MQRILNFFGKRNLLTELNQFLLKTGFFTMRAQFLFWILQKQRNKCGIYTSQVLEHLLKRTNKRFERKEIRLHEERQNSDSITKARFCLQNRTISPDNRPNSQRSYAKTRQFAPFVWLSVSNFSTGYSLEVFVATTTTLGQRAYPVRRLRVGGERSRAVWGARP